MSFENKSEEIIQSKAFDKMEAGAYTADLERAKKGLLHEEESNMYTLMHSEAFEKAAQVDKEKFIEELSYLIVLNRLQQISNRTSSKEKDEHQNIYGNIFDTAYAIRDIFTKLGVMPDQPRDVIAKAYWNYAQGVRGTGGTKYEKQMLIEEETLFKYFLDNR